METSRFEIAQQDAQAAWGRLISSIGDQPTRLGFKPVVTLLMIAIIENHDKMKISSAPLNPLLHKRLEQIQNAWTETPTKRTIPVGVVLVGEVGGETNH